MSKVVYTAEGKNRARASVEETPKFNEYQVYAYLPFAGHPSRFYVRQFEGLTQENLIKACILANALVD